MKFAVLSLIFALLALNNANAQIKAKFSNNTNKVVNLKISTGEPTDPTDTFKEIYSQTIQPGYNDQNYIVIKEAKKKKKILITGTISGIGNVKFQELVVTQKNQLVSVSLDISATEVPTDNSSYQQLISQLNYTPPKGSEKVMSADMAYKTYFGALSLRKAGLEIDRIEPNVFKAEVTPVQYGTLNRTIELFFSGNFISDNQGTAPGIASVNLSVSRDELYKLKYNLSNIGNIVWSNAQNKSIAQLFAELDEINKQSLALRYLADSTLKLFQYDNMYLFNIANIQIEKYKRTSTTIDASVPVFFSSNTAFKKEDSENYTTSAASTVLNIWATKDVTYLLAQNAKNYLTKQKQAVLRATTAKDAQNVISASNAIVPESIELPVNASKEQIVKGLDVKINDLRQRAIR